MIMAKFTKQFPLGMTNKMYDELLEYVSEEGVSSVAEAVRGFIRDGLNTWKNQKNKKSMKKR